MIFFLSFFIIFLTRSVVSVLFPSAAVQSVPEDQPDGQQRRSLLQEDSGSRLHSEAPEEVAVRRGRAR